MKATCTGHAAALAWKDAGGKGFPVLPEAGVAMPNGLDPNRLDIKFLDGSWLTLERAPRDGRLCVFWSAQG